MKGIPFTNQIHQILARYILSKRLMEEQVHLSEIFEFFEENTPEYDELTRILDYSDGAGLTGEVAEKYYADSLVRLRTDFIDGEIDELSAKITSSDDVGERKRCAARITELLKQKEKIKNGVQ